MCFQHVRHLFKGLVNDWDAQICLVWVFFQVVQQVSVRFTTSNYISSCCWKIKLLFLLKFYFCYQYWAYLTFITNFVCFRYKTRFVSSFFFVYVWGLFVECLCVLACLFVCLFVCCCFFVVLFLRTTYNIWVLCPLRACVFVQNSPVALQYRYVNRTVWI